MKRVVTTVAITLLTGCVTTPPVSPEAAQQLREVGIGYGVFVGTQPADDPSSRRLCAEDKVRPTFRKFCGQLHDFKVATFNVAATSGKSFLKVLVVVPNELDLMKGDIVQFRFEDADGYIKLASRGERPDCKWAGSPPWTIGFPGQEGGIECEGWSFKSVLHINWLNR